MVKYFITLCICMVLAGCGTGGGSLGPPGSPAGVTAAAGNTQVVIQWPAVTGAVSYNVYYGTAAGVTTGGKKLSGAASGSAITGLINGTTYYFAITAVNPGGESPLSGEVSATPQSPAMTNPATGNATNITDTFATINGSFTNPAGYTTEAWFDWGATSAYGTVTGHQLYAYQGSITPSFDITSLSLGTAYHYRLCTKNADAGWCGGDKTFTTVPMAAKTTLVSNLTYPVQFALDASSLYWSEGGINGAIKKASLTGGAVTTIASGLNDPYGIAVDGANIYWTEQGGGNVKMVPVAGGEPVTLATSLNSPQFIAVDSASVYITEFGTWNSGAGIRSTDGAVDRIPISGGAVVTLASGLNGPQTIAVDAAHVYWTEVANFSTGEGKIKRVPVGGGTVTALITGLTGSQNIAKDASTVYFWAGYGSMATIPVGGATAGNPMVGIASGMNGTPPLAIDAASVYWFENVYGGTLKKLNKSSLNVSVLTSGLSNAQWIAVDDKNIYWMEGDVFRDNGWSGVGVIRKISK